MRFIGILPTITKIFELAILHYLEEAVKSPIFLINQRGFIKENQHQITCTIFFKLPKLKNTFKKINKKEKPTIIFYDFKEAYDSIPRGLFLRKYIRGYPGISRIYFSNFLINFFPKIYPRYPGSKLVKTIIRKNL